MKLKDTTPLMTSDNYKERFQAEYHQLKTRTGKLMSMLEQWDKGILPFTPTCPRRLLEKQLMSMLDYMAVLSLRAQLEGIDLKEGGDNHDTSSYGR